MVNISQAYFSCISQNSTTIFVPFHFFFLFSFFRNNSPAPLRNPLVFVCVCVFEYTCIIWIWGKDNLNDKPHLFTQLTPVLLTDIHLLTQFSKPVTRVFRCISSLYRNQYSVVLLSEKHLICRFSSCYVQKSLGIHQYEIGNKFLTFLSVSSKEKLPFFSPCF